MYRGKIMGRDIKSSPYYDYIGVILPHEKEHLGLPEAGRGKKGPFPIGFRGSMADT